MAFSKRIRAINLNLRSIWGEMCIHVKECSYNTCQLYKVKKGRPTKLYLVGLLFEFSFIIYGSFLDGKAAMK